MRAPCEIGSSAPAVLIVDDDAEIVYLVRLFLERAGHQVSVARNGRDAVALLAGPPPALILLDVLMPFQDGFNLLARIRTTPAWSAVPIIMLTAMAQEGDIVRALDAGANDYIVKPFQPDELLARVRRYVKVST